jgi:Uma2 family endonuclease
MVMSLAPAKVVTADEFLRMSHTDGFELLRGELVEKKMGAQSSYIGGQLLFALNQHCLPNKLGWVFPGDATYRCFPNIPHHIRKPDVSFVRRGRFPKEELPIGAILFAPDLAAEILSPSELYYEVEEKAEEFLAAGTPLIWLVYPPARSVRILRGNGTRTEIGYQDVLEGEDVIPGFRCPVATLFPHVHESNGAV